MKINGQKIEGPNIVYVAIPRQPESLIFAAKAVLDYSEFERLCPRPLAPIKTMNDGIKIENFDNPEFKKKISEFAKQRMAWMVIESLKATEGLEWEKVKSDSPESWLEYDKELSDAGLTEVEKIRIFNGVLEANGLDQDKIDKALHDFLASREKKLAASFSPNIESLNTPSGEPVKD